MEYDAPFDPDRHGAEPIPEPEDDYSFDEDRHPDDLPSDRAGMSPVALAALIVVVLGVVIGAFWWLAGDRGEPAARPAVAAGSAADQPAAGAAAAPEPAVPAEAVELPSLAASDAFVRRSAARLSAHPALVRWLARDDLVRRSVASVANIAEGGSPRSHLEFMAPKDPFRAKRSGDRLEADPKTYARYDLMVDVFTSLDIATAVQLFHAMEPLLDEAYREIAPPGARFRTALAKAIDRLLQVQVPAQSPQLAEGVLSYRYADPQLEELSPAEKHLLRLGPERAKRVQTKLQFLKAGLDLR